MLVLEKIWDLLFFKIFSENKKYLSHPEYSFKAVNFRYRSLKMDQANGFGKR